MKINNYIIYALIVLVNLIYVRYSYIDDTDETYGYWEPLHYLLEGKGMQTWEYSPNYAIRSYAFIYPFYGLAYILKYLLDFDKLSIFYGIKLVISLLNSFGLISLIQSLKSIYNMNVIYIMVAFMISSPGLYIAGCSFLPSSICMMLTTYALAAFISNNYKITILLGCLSVLWTGWPFVGVIYLPLGMIILIRNYKTGDLTKVFSIFTYGLICLLVVLLSASAIDIQMYEKWTSPTINILLYNASGNGDNLYGIESTSYYIRNLLLNMGISWPLALSNILIIIKEIFNIKLSKILNFNDRELVKIGLYASGFIWLGLLFSRPHKEERFMYPIYPLIAIIGAESLYEIFIILYNITTSLLILFSQPQSNNIISGSNQSMDKTHSKIRKRKNQINKNDVNYELNDDFTNKKIFVRFIIYLVVSIILFFNAVLGLMRVTSNYINYNGK